MGVRTGLGDRPAAAPSSTVAHEPGDIAHTPSRDATAVRPGELRGIYVVRHSLRTADTIDEVIRQADAVGANALFVQVNGRGEAYYNSDVTVKAPDVAAHFDPLQYVLEKARANDLAVHAWINAYTAGMLLDTPTDPEHVLNRHPQWVTVDRSGRSLWDYTWQEAQVHVPARMLDPGLPEVEEHVVRAVADVTEKYAVDGIHIDYIRYPSTRFGFHPESIARFEAVHGFDPLALIAEAPAFVARHGRPEFERRTGLWDDWRRERVTDLVKRLGDNVRRRPGMMFSVAVDPNVQEAVQERLQDWPTWIADGLVDAVVPMAYSADSGVAAAYVQDALDAATTGNVHVYAALGAYMVADEPDELLAQMESARQAGAAGTIMFSHDTLMEYTAVADTVAGEWR